jgi:hypothetical protein
MPTPVIAIVGSYDSKRIAELALEGTPDDAKQAGEALGTALATEDDSQNRPVSSRRQAAPIEK